MLKQNYAKAALQAKKFSIIPVYREIPAGTISPVDLLEKPEFTGSRCFLFESAESGEKRGRYSFLGFDPPLRVTCMDGIVRTERSGIVTEERTKKPLDILRAIQAEYSSPGFDDMPPFTGGFAGYFAYSMIGYAEPKLVLSRRTNDFDMMLFDKVIAFDHQRQKICIIVNIKTDRFTENYMHAEAELENIAGLICDRQPVPERACGRDIEFTCNFSKEEYCAAVERAKEYIRCGDIFQVVLSRKFSAPYEGGLTDAYRVLRTSNPSPYMVYIKTDEDELICSSPETLVSLKNGRLVTFPVAGSRPRGKTEQEDKKLEEELLADEKELAEHNMLVDLGRNDLGKICKYGSVRVTDYKMVHRYSKIMHICSRVEGDILPGCDGYDAIEAVLPAGTLSGAPKIRACEIIEELERESRGIYGGAIGYLDFCGGMDTCIAIRMAVKREGRVHIQAGGGIVADSIPENEYEESANKALAVMNAVIRAGRAEKK